MPKTYGPKRRRKIKKKQPQKNSERIKQTVSKAIVWEFRADSMRKLLNVSCGVGVEVRVENVVRLGVGVEIRVGTKIGTQ